MAAMTTSAKRMPAIFFGHGNPMYAIEPNRYSDAWRRLGESLPRPAAVLAVSAHWYTRGTAVTAMAQPRTLHDFGGFPRALIDVQYPAPGSPALARRVQQLLAPTTVHLDEDATRGWGLDHGTWSVLTHVFHEEDVQVVQLSIDGTQPPAWHYTLAQRLTRLGDEGVLITVCGYIVHNLRRLDWSGGGSVFDWGQRFSDLVRDRLLAGDHAALIDYLSFGDDAHESAPTPKQKKPLRY